MLELERRSADLLEKSPGGIGDKYARDFFVYKEGKEKKGAREMMLCNMNGLLQKIPPEVAELPL